MCGLFGLFTDGGVNDLLSKTKLVNNSFIGTMLRGVDSTGMFTVDDEGEIDVFKRAVHAADFISLSSYKSRINNLMDNPILVGHCRAATMGGVSEESAHPFKHGDITLVHNGTLRGNWRSISKGVTNIDSEAICMALAEGVDIRDLVQEMTGAFTLLWYDARDYTINMIRNDERPLCLMNIKDMPKDNYNTWYAGSEVNMMQWLALRNGFEIKELTMVKPGDLYSMSLFDMSHWVVESLDMTKKWGTYHHYNRRNAGVPQQTQKTLPTAVTETITKSSGNETNMTGGQTTEDKRTIGVKFLEDELLIKKGESIVFSPISWHRYAKSQRKGFICGILESHQDDAHVVYVHDISHRQWKKIDKEGRPLYRTTALSAHNKGKDTIIIGHNKKLEKLSQELDDWLKNNNVVNLVKGPAGIMITKEEFDQLTKHGCDGCGNNVMEEDAPTTQWTVARKPICPTCQAEYNWNGAMMQ